MLLNIDPKYRASLHSIQLATVCRTQLIEKYPINEVLEPFMSSIKCLERVSYESCMHGLLYEYLHTRTVLEGFCMGYPARCISFFQL